MVATGSRDVIEECIESDDLVIVGDRDETHICALEENASCMVVTGGTQVSAQVLEMANRRDWCRDHHAIRYLYGSTSDQSEHADQIFYEKRKFCYV